MKFITSKILIKKASEDTDNLLPPPVSTPESEKPPSIQPMPKVPKHPPEFMNILHDIKNQGGRPLMVGGFVRDQFTGEEPKDRDVEVYNMHPDTLEQTLGQHGNVNAVGKSFGVLKLGDYDFSTPRRESKIGEGHKGFLATPDPNMTEKEAFGRRDFTANAIGQDPFSGEYIDHYGGINDIKNKKLRATTEAYKEDPLRVLRGAQMAARFGWDMDEPTKQMSRDIHHTYPELDKSRVWTEWEKLAQKGQVPSKGLGVLNDTGWISHMPHLDNEPHRAQAIDNIAKINKDKKIEGTTKSALFYSTLLHDKNPQQAAEFLKEIGAPNDISKRVIAMNSVPKKLSTDPAAINNLAVKLGPNSIDNYLDVVSASNPKEAKLAEQVRQIAHQKGILHGAPKPLINGEDLMNIGYKQGPELGKALKDIFQAQLDGHVNSKEDALHYLKQKKSF